MRGLNNHHSTRTIAVGHAFAQNLRPGHYDLATENDIRIGWRQRSLNSLPPSDLDQDLHLRTRRGGSVPTTQQGLPIA